MEDGKKTGSKRVEYTLNAAPRCTDDEVLPSQSVCTFAILKMASGLRRVDKKCILDFFLFWMKLLEEHGYLSYTTGNIYLYMLYQW